MNATRTIPGRPIRSGPEVAGEIIDLVARTLDPSPGIATEDVRAELEAARPALALLAAGGQLADGALALAAADLRLVINVPVGEAALTATENIAAPRGAAAATNWTLHVAATGGMTALAESASLACAHVSTDPLPAASSRSETGSASAAVDLTRLLDRGNR